MADPVAVILAAGKSTRMKSPVPKVLHEVCGRPMIEYVLDAVRAAGVKRVVVIVGHRADLVQDALKQHADIEFALQSDQKGTGHAVMMCEENLRDHDGPVLVLASDTPLLEAQSLTGLLDDLRNNDAACVIGTAVTSANQGLGRVVRAADGAFVKIVEQKDATPEEAAIEEINTGCYTFDGQALFDALRRVRPDNSQAEYYLTDCPAILKADGRPVVAALKLTIEEAMGVNTRAQLAQVEYTLRQTHLNHLMVSGVTIIAPEMTYIDPRSTIGIDSVIHPFTIIRGAANVGEQCQIGPHAVLEDGAHIPDGGRVGPFQVVSGT